MVQRRGCRLSPVQISSLSLHTLVFSTLGLNVKWGVCMCVWLSCKCVCVCMSVCLHGCCVGQASGHPGRSSYLARLLQLSRQKDECFPHSSLPHICPHRPHRPFFSDVVFSKANPCPCAADPSSPKPGKQLTPWELCTGGLGCGKGKEASSGWSQSPLTIASLYWLCRIHQATVLSSLALLLAGTQEGGYLARSPGVCRDPGFVLGL